MLDDAGCAHKSRAGHLGLRRTYNSLNNMFPGHDISITQVTEYKELCPLCQMPEDYIFSQLVPIVRLPKTSNPGKVVGLDYLSILLWTSLETLAPMSSETISPNLSTFSPVLAITQRLRLCLSSTTASCTEYTTRPRFGSNVRSCSCGEQVARNTPQTVIGRPSRVQRCRRR